MRESSSIERLIFWHILASAKSNYTSNHSVMLFVKDHLASLVHSTSGFLLRGNHEQITTLVHWIMNSTPKIFPWKCSPVPMSISVSAAGGPAQSDSNEGTAQCSWATQSEQASRVQAASALSHTLMRRDHELVRAPFPAPLIRTAFIISGPVFCSGAKSLTYYFLKGSKSPFEACSCVREYSVDI